eukprot:8287237-Pyramimonas_sp.AAC.1
MTEKLVVSSEVHAAQAVCGSRGPSRISPSLCCPNCCVACSMNATYLEKLFHVGVKQMFRSAPSLFASQAWCFAGLAFMFERLSVLWLGFRFMPFSL